MQGPCYSNRTSHFKYTSHIRRGNGDFVVNFFLTLGKLGKGLTLLLRMLRLSLTKLSKVEQNYSLDKIVYMAW